MIRVGLQSDLRANRVLFLRTNPPCRAAEEAASSPASPNFVRQLTPRVVSYCDFCILDGMHIRKATEASRADRGRGLMRRCFDCVCNGIPAQD